MDYKPGYGESGRLPTTSSDLLTVAEVDELTSFVDAKQKKLQERLQNKRIRGFRLKKIETFTKTDRIYCASGFEGLDYNALAEMV